MHTTRPRSETGVIDWQPQRYGTSVLGQALEIWIPESSDCDCLIFAGIHGEEPETTVLLSRLLRSLQSPPKRTAVILCANPDGLVRGTRGNANGVDLNRNFPASNWSPEPATHRWTVDEPDRILLSPGKEPASEPETRALIRKIELLNPPHIVALHAPLACIDDPLKSDLGKQLARESGFPLVTDIGYPTPGSLGSWASDQGRHVITYELEVAGIEKLICRHLPVLQKLVTSVSSK